VRLARPSMLTQREWLKMERIMKNTIVLKPARSHNSFSIRKSHRLYIDSGNIQNQTLKKILLEQSCHPKASSSRSRQKCTIQATKSARKIRGLGPRTSKLGRRNRNAEQIRGQKPSHRRTISPRLLLGRPRLLDDFDNLVNHAGIRKLLNVRRCLPHTSNERGGRIRWATGRYPANARRVGWLPRESNL
jgi:hypothetical protein